MVKLFVVGYPLDIEEDEVIEMFSSHGMVHLTNLLRDSTTQKHKGFGFVEMLDQQGEERAIAALNGLRIRDRKLTVKFAD